MRRRFPHQPALEGIRAICLIAILLFHSDFSWAAGGYLGVSTFFTLSGFLITSILTHDLEANGRGVLGRFWARRVRRLAPASLVTLTLVALSYPLWVPAGQLARLGPELLATLTYVVNWSFVSEDYAYALLFTSPSALQHFWSIAIEGQFYLVFPPLLVLGLRLTGGRPRGALWLLAAVAAAALASAALGVWLGADETRFDRIYFGTDTRVAELLVGAALALILDHRDRATGRVVAWGLDLAGMAALALLVIAMKQVALGTPLLYRGGFLAYALLSALLLLACLRGSGLVRGVLSLEPLRTIGRISYGAYLYHWPVFLMLSPGRLGIGVAETVALRIVVTLSLAWLSYRYLEEPIRRGRGFGARLGTLPAAAATLALGLLVVARFPDSSLGVLTSLPGFGTQRVQTLDGSVTQIAIFGDSTALSLRYGFLKWAADQGGVQIVGGATPLGCSILGTSLVEHTRDRGLDWLVLMPGGAPRKERTHRRLGVRKQCLDSNEVAGRRTARFKPDLAVVLVGLWEISGVWYPNDGRLHTLGEKLVDDAMRTAIEDYVDLLSAHGGRVVWLTSPPLKPGPNWHFAEERIDVSRRRLNELLHEVERTRPETLRVVDFGGYVNDRSGGAFDRALRPDGGHYSKSGARALVAEWLGARTLEAAFDRSP